MSAGLQALKARTGAEQPAPWPPLLASIGPGDTSDGHAHHAMHLVVSTGGPLRVRAAGGDRLAHGVLTAPDVPHAIDARGTEILLVFIDPESDVGRGLVRGWSGPVRVLSEDEAARARRGADPLRIMGPEGVTWLRGLAAILGDAPPPERPPPHPRVLRVLRHLRALPTTDVSLAALAAQAELSPSRLMHAFTESVGVPLRQYLLWLRLQTAAAAIVSGVPLAQAAAHAGFSDAAHMSRTFRRMFGMPPSRLRPPAS